MAGPRKVGRTTEGNAELSEASSAAGAELPSSMADSESSARPTSIDFFQHVRDRIAERRGERNVLFNIPIWGWTADGKTCALLTAVHYCDRIEHGISLAYVDKSELAKMESATAEYSGLNLASIATATKERLTALSEMFIEQCIWPPGNDQPIPYILALKSVNATLGYAFFPDLQGGRYREGDELASAVLDRAHACIILVKPDHYVSSKVDGKRYRDEVAERIQFCAERKIPACIMITRCDLYPGTNSAADETQKRLTMLLTSHSGFVADIFRVSVIGNIDSPEALNGHPATSVALPPSDQRKPDDLVRAFVWVFDKALEQPASTIRQVVPPVHLRKYAEPVAEISTRSVPELRQVAEDYQPIGRILCGTGNDVGSASFLFLANSGALSLVSVSGGDSHGQPRSMGAIENWGNDLIDVEAHDLAGELIVGSRRNAKSLWYGTLGDQIAKTPLPFDIVSWAPIGQRRVCALDMNGRLHILELANGQWSQQTYLADLIPPTDFLLCGYVASASYIVAFNGREVEGVKILPGGNLGERIKPGLFAAYDSTECHVNSVGMIAAASKNHALVTSVSTKPQSLGVLHPTATHRLAIASGTRRLAALGPDLRLTASLVSADGVRSTEAAYSPTLRGEPASLAWNRGGTALAASFEDGRWAIYRPMGLAEA